MVKLSALLLSLLLLALASGVRGASVAEFEAVRSFFDALGCDNESTLKSLRRRDLTARNRHIRVYLGLVLT